ncbi:MAG: Dabb family protein [Verrucomicrobiota bacterium]|nr:Dabb family protein [Verrucomicrobiota bacterium]
MSKIKHIALLKFKEGTTPEQLDALFGSILDLSENIDGLEDYVSGPNSSPENLDQGYTHGFIMTFRDTAARDAYLVHPEHEQFKQTYIGLVESVAIVDFEV